MNRPEDWGITLEGFEEGSWGNVIGTFKVPASIARRFTLSTDEEVAKLFDSIAYRAMNYIIKWKKVLKTIKFEWLLENTKIKLREAVYLMIQFMVLNNTIWEKVNASSMSTGSFSINVDNPAYLLNIDTMGKAVTAKVAESNIDNYKVIDDQQDGFLTQLTTSGNITIGKFDEDIILELF